MSDEMMRCHVIGTGWLQYTCSTLRPAKHSSFRDRCGMFYDETTLWKNARMGIWGMLNCNFWVGFVSNGCFRTCKTAQVRVSIQLVI